MFLFINDQFHVIKNFPPLFRIEWEIDPSYSGERPGSLVPAFREEINPIDLAIPGTVCVETGDTIEFWFDVRAAVDGLPQVYGDMSRTMGAITQGEEPVYFPRVGEYWHSYQWYNWNVNPSSGGSFTNAAPGGIFPVNNGSVLMDMDSLLHESAFTACCPKNTDRWEMFDGSLTFIPGESRIKSPLRTIFTTVPVPHFF